MSAILGRVQLDGERINEVAFRRALAVLMVYGTDGRGIWVDGAAGLGQHCKTVARRETVQGAVSELGSWRCVADAILDNRNDLITDLAIDPGFARTLADDALILRAYAKWGPDCNQHLDGDYAFAIWDKTTHSVFLSRDHIGTRPLYWRQDGATVVFATDVRALVQFEDLAWEIDPQAVLQFMSGPNNPMKRGFFKGLQICPPGGHVIINAAGVQTVPWWDVSAGKRERYKRPEDYAARLRELLDCAIAAKIDTDLPIGSHVSGGIDSTAVTCVAQKQLRAQGRGLAMGYAWAPAFSETYPDMGPKDERHTIQALAERDGFDVHWGTATGQDLLDLIRQPMQFEGTADLADELPVVRQAQQDGIGVMLSGWGGDEGFSAKGHGVLAGLVRQGRWLKAVQTITKLSKRRNPKFVAYKFWEMGMSPLLPNWLGKPWEPKFETFDVLEFANKAFERTYQGECSPRSLLRYPGAARVMMHYLAWGHIAARMETWSHWSLGAFQYRYPLCDRALLEFMYNIPDAAHVHGGHLRAPALMALTDVTAATHRKFDTANERRRERMMGCFLQQIAGNPLFQIDSPIIDLERLQLFAEFNQREKNDPELIDIMRILHCLRAASITF